MAFGPTRKQPQKKSDWSVEWWLVVGKTRPIRSLLFSTQGSTTPTTTRGINPPGAADEKFPLCTRSARVASPPRNQHTQANNQDQSRTRARNRTTPLQVSRQASMPVMALAPWGLWKTKQQPRFRWYWLGPGPGQPCVGARVAHGRARRPGQSLALGRESLRLPEWSALMTDRPGGHRAWTPLRWDARCPPGRWSPRGTRNTAVALHFGDGFNISGNPSLSCSNFGRGNGVDGWVGIWSKSLHLPFSRRSHGVHAQPAP
jgi:hypothetical protein